MQVRFMVCADSYSLDMARNSLSVFHILEEINTPVLPGVIPSMSVIVLLARDDHEPNEPLVELRITLGEQELYRGPLAVNFQNHPRSRSLGDIRGFVLPGPGMLTVSIRSQEHELASWPIVVRLVGPPEVNIQNVPGA